MKAKKWLLRILCVIGGYFLLLLALTAAESSDPDASIRSFTDALWYSIVTLSTVGYGDLYPVTALGKLIGLLFVLLSVGALAVLVGSVVSLLTGQMLPRLQLRALRNRNWYVFSQMNDASVTLARSLAAQEPKAVLLFPSAQRDQAPAELNCCFYPDTMAAAVAGKKGDCSLFFMDTQSGVNYPQALQAIPLGHPIYCRTEQTLDRCPEHLHLFNRYECCARDYWRSHGMGKDEKTVLLIGDGRYARQLLEQGLTVNVFGSDRTVHYHVFGDWSDFCRCHPQLGLTVSLDAPAPDRDSIFFHADAWNADAQLLQQADRIILCDDDDQRNAAVLHPLRKFFPVSAAVHLRSAADHPDEITFGTDEGIYSAQNILASRRNAAAQSMHRIYLRSTGSNGPTWQELSEFTRQSNIAAADHLLVKIRLLLDDPQITEVTAQNCEKAYSVYCRTRAQRAGEYRYIEHLRWMRFHSLYNWRYGPVRDNARRIHPMMVPFDALSEQEQAKDDYAWQLLEALARDL